MAAVRRCLVIDTNIARSAGTSEAPLSKICRGILDSIKNSGHKLVLTTSQKQEWDRHKSNYAKLWLTQMISRKQYCFLKSEPDTGFIDNLYKLDCGSKQRQEMLKDIFLLELALATDRIVLSSDDAMYNYLCKFGVIIGLNQEIVWANPKSFAFELWLAQGAPHQGMRMIPLEQEDI